MPRKVKVLQFNKFGPWSKALMATKHLDKDLHNAFLRGQEKALKKVARAVKEHIERQDLPVLTLNPKKRSNNDPRTLIDTRSYIDSIKTWRENYTYYVGVKSGLIEPKSKAEITKVAYWLEKGTRKMVARPVWGPTFRELGGTKYLEKVVNETIEQYLKRRGW
jgi:hypothetical protein